jgi:hypothetical protein
MTPQTNEEASLLVFQPGGLSLRMDDGEGHQILGCALEELGKLFDIERHRIKDIRNRDMFIKEDLLSG